MANDININLSAARALNAGASGVPRFDPATRTDVRQAPGVQPVAAEAAIGDARSAERAAASRGRVSAQQFEQQIRRLETIQAVEAEKKISEIQLQVQQAGKDIVESADPQKIQEITLDTFDQIAQQNLESENLTPFQKRLIKNNLVSVRDSVGRKAFNIQTEVQNEEARFSAAQKLSLDRKIVFEDPSLLNEKVAEIESSIDQLEGLRQTEKKKILQRYKEDLTVASVSGLIKKDPDLAFQQLQDGTFDKNLSLEKKQNLLSDAQSFQEALSAEVQKNLENRRSETDANVGVRIATGSLQELPSRTELDNLREQDLLSDGQWEQHVKALNRRFEDETSEANSLSLGAEIVSNGIPVNPQNRDQVNAFNEYYNSIQPLLDGMEPRQRNVQIANILKNNRIVPDQLKGRLQSAARSANPDEVVQAAEIYETVANQAPHMVENLGSENDIARLRMVNQRLSAGFQQSQAVQAVDQIMAAERNPETKKRLAEASKNIDFRDESFDALSSVQGVGDFFDLIRPFKSIVNRENVFTKKALDDASLDYRLKFEEHFAKTSDEDLSHKRAKEHVKGRYGRSIANGKDREIIMKFPPEAKVSLAGDNIADDWMREQVIKDAQEIISNSLLGEETIKRFPDNLRIEPIPGITERTWVQGRPAYDLVIVNERGQPVSLLDPETTGDTFVFDPEQGREQVLKKQQNKKESRSFNTFGVSSSSAIGASINAD